ncbi:(2Fe-2S)-binding protein [Sporosarcina sp. 6E9]|uniref:(2Fe-2S)-binding protein n=1 Tax=Sporosarcina sp. 6E9 TaxID=2819235 RepID=UPI001B30BFAB
MGLMDKLIICRCEEVSLEDIENTASLYNCSARELKLRTRAGMGYCGGRTCRPAVDAVLEEVTGEKPGNDIPLKVQPPVRPVSLSVLGGKKRNE